MLYQNNPTPEFSIANPLARTIEEGESIIEQLQVICEELENCIAQEQTLASHFKEIKQAYDDAENELLGEAIVSGIAKEGLLAGVAPSTKSHDIVCNSLRSMFRHNQLAPEWQRLEKARNDCETAQSARQQAELRFSALRYAAKLKTGILEASVI